VDRQNQQYFTLNKRPNTGYHSSLATGGISLEDTAVTTTFPSNKMQIVDHALKIACSSPKRNNKSSKNTKKLASSSKESKSPRHSEQAEPIQGVSLDETAPLSPDRRSCSSGTAFLAHPPQSPHLHISHLKQEAPLSAGSSSPGWRLREVLKAKLSPGSGRRGTFRRKVLNVNDLTDASRIAALNTASSPGKVKLTKDEGMLARHSKDRKKEAKRSKLTLNGHTRRKLERPGEQEAAKQRVLEQAAEQLQQFAPHNRPGVAHHAGAGAEVDERASCLLVNKIPAEVLFHAKGFLGKTDHDEDDDDQSMGSFASTLTPSVRSIEQQKGLMQSSRWDVMDDSIMTLYGPKGKNAPLAGWQLRECIKSSGVPALATTPDSKPVVPIRHQATHTQDDGDDFLGFLNATAVHSEPDCKPAAPIRQVTAHDEGRKCVAPKLPDEGQDFLAFLQTKVQGEKEQLDAAPIPPMKRSFSIKAQASKLEAAVSKPSVSLHKRWVPSKKACGKGNDLPPAFSTVNASYERLSSSMRSFGAVKATSSSIPDCKPAAPIRQSTRHEGEKRVAPSKLPDEEVLLMFLQNRAHQEAKDQPPLLTPSKKELYVQNEPEKEHFSMASLGSFSLGDGIVNEEKKEQRTPATIPALSSSRKRWSPRKSNGKDLPCPPVVVTATNESFARLHSSVRSVGAVNKDAMNSATQDSKPAVPIRQSTRHDSETCMASKLPDEGQDFLGFLQKVVMQERKPDPPPATEPTSPMKNGKDVPAAFAVLKNQSLRSISSSSTSIKGSKGDNKVSQEPPAALPASPKKGCWTPLKSFYLERKSDHNVSTHASPEKNYLVSPATSEATTEKKIASQAIKHRVASRHGELLEERNKGPETSGRTGGTGGTGRSTPASPHSANHTRSPKVKYQRNAVVKPPSTRESPVEKSGINGASQSHVSMDKLENRVSGQSASDKTSAHPSEDNDVYTRGSGSRLCAMFPRQSASEPSVSQSGKNGSGHTRGSEWKLSEKASKPATSINEPSEQVPTENSKHSSSHTPGSKIKFQKKASKRSLKDKPPFNDSADKNDSTHTAGPRIKLKRISKTLAECVNNGSSHTAGFKIKLKRISKEFSANNGSSQTAGSRIKLKRLSNKKSLKDETFVEKSRHGSKGELSKNFLFTRPLAGLSMNPQTRMLVAPKESSKRKSRNDV
jgi:hypothetical protein